MERIDRLCIDTLRFLAADAVENAGSGHPGMPMGAAPAAYVLWDRFLEHNPRNPGWPDRDRFILSAGHGCALLYSLLHLTGYDLPLDELRRLRKWGSRTPGHPEARRTPGVEVTTGPLGQGFAMGLGMALAERRLAATFNVDGHPVVDHYTYAIVSDGDLMEGISYEASSLAGHLGLGKMIYLYDENHITIDGSTELAFSDDVTGRFEALGWHVEEVRDGNDVTAIERAIATARDETARPSLIRVHTHIAYGSPKQDSAAAHGKPLGEDALRAAKEKLGWPVDAPFHVPDEARARFARAALLGQKREAAWRQALARYREDHPELAAELVRRLDDIRRQGWTSALPVFDPDDGPMATRAASHTVLAALEKPVPELLGGSADLASSNKTAFEDSPDFDRTHAGRNIHYGVREHAMAAAMNGMAMHGGVRPFVGTFLTFSDYMRPAIRIAALMEARSIFVLTHDSIGLGGDGPTHQPVEHLVSLRAMPNLWVVRPADPNETRVAWEMAIEHDGPTALVLTRQDVPVLPLRTDPDGDGVSPEGMRRGAYVVAGHDPDPDVLLIATGSEVHLALEARVKLLEEGVRARVVSMPCQEVFLEQSEEYRDEVLPPPVQARVSIEAAAPHGWARWTGDHGVTLAVGRFGSSAPGDEVLRHFGFTPELVVDAAHSVLGATASSVLHS